MDGHVAIVTGGAQNIRKGIARTFSGAGANEMIADLDGDKALRTARALAEETGDPLEISTEDMVESYKLNCLSAMRMTAACRPHLLAADNASITNFGSMVGVVPAFDFLAYSAAKAALNHLMLGLAHYFAKQFRFNSVLIARFSPPGTPRRDWTNGPNTRSLIPTTHRPSRYTRDVANAFLWLASPAAGWVSGQTVQVAGGGTRVRLKPG